MPIQVTLINSGAIDKANQAISIANNALNIAYQALNTTTGGSYEVDVYVANNIVLANSKLNFVNTANINVHTTNNSTITNVSFDLNASAVISSGNNINLGTYANGTVVVPNIANINWNDTTTVNVSITANGVQTNVALSANGTALGIPAINAALGTMNTQFAAANAAFATLNTDITNIESALSTDNTYFATVNGAFSTTNTTFGTLNTNISTVYSQANSQGTYANGTLVVANIANINFNNTTTINVNVTANGTQSNINLTANLTAIGIPAIEAALATDNTYFGTVNGAISAANAAFSTDNAYFATVNSAFSTTNTAITDIEAALATDNTYFATINGAFSTTNSTFGTLNSAISTAYNQANSQGTYANGTLVIANIANINFNNTTTTNVNVTANGHQTNVNISVNIAQILMAVVTGNTSNIVVNYAANGDAVIDTRVPTGGGGGNYEVDVYANGTSVLANANLNFNNTSTVNVSITANGTTQANIAFIANMDAILAGVITGNSSNINVTYDANGNVAIDTRAAPGSTPPAGPNTAVQFNNNGVFGGSANLSFNLKANTLEVGSVGGGINIESGSVVTGGANGTTLYMPSNGVLSVAAGGNTVLNVSQTSINVAYNLNVVSNISNTGNLLVTQNTYTGNLSVTTNAAIGTIVLAKNITSTLTGANVPLGVYSLNASNLTVTTQANGEVGLDIALAIDPEFNSINSALSATNSAFSTANTYYGTVNSAFSTTNTAITGIESALATLNVANTNTSVLNVTANINFGPNSSSNLKTNVFTLNAFSNTVLVLIPNTNLTAQVIFSQTSVNIGNATGVPPIFNVAGNTVTGNLNVLQNTSLGNVSITQNGSFGNITTANINVTAVINAVGNISGSNLVLSQNIANVGNLLVTQNSFTGNLSATQNILTGNISFSANMPNVTNAVVMLASNVGLILSNTTGPTGNVNLFLTSNIGNITNAVVLTVNSNTSLNVTGYNGGIVNIGGNIANVGNVLVTQNTFTGNLSVTTNAAIGTIVLAKNITSTLTGANVPLGVYALNTSNLVTTVQANGEVSIDTVHAWGTGGGGSPGGANTQIQFNAGGSFNGTANMSFNLAANTVEIGSIGAGINIESGATVTGGQNGVTLFMPANSALGIAINANTVLNIAQTSVNVTTLATFNGNAQFVNTGAIFFGGNVANTANSFFEVYANTTANALDILAVNGSGDNVGNLFAGNISSGNIQISNANALTISINTASLAFTVPITPPANNTTIFARPLGNRIMPAFVGPSGLDSILQPFLARNQISVWDWVGSSTDTVTNFGMAAPTQGGTATTRTPIIAADAPSNTGNAIVQVCKRGGLIAIANGASAAPSGVWERSSAQYFMGNTAGIGGFTCVTRLIITDNTAAAVNSQMFVGFSSTTIANNQNMDTLRTAVGFCQNGKSNCLQILVANAGATFLVNTGITCNVGNTQLWDLAIFAAPNTGAISAASGFGTVSFVATDMANTQNTYFTSVGTNGLLGAGYYLPLGNTAMLYQAFRSANANASVASTSNTTAGLDMVSVYIEQDL